MNKKGTEAVTSNCPGRAREYNMFCRGVSNLKMSRVTDREKSSRLLLHELHDATMDRALDVTGRHGTPFEVSLPPPVE